MHTHKPYYNHLQTKFLSKHVTSLDSYLQFLKIICNLQNSEKERCIDIPLLTIWIIALLKDCNENIILV